jgi:hypothetical protein
LVSVSAVERGAHLPASVRTVSVILRCIRGRHVAEAGLLVFQDRFMPVSTPAAEAVVDRSAGR